MEKSTRGVLLDAGLELLGRVGFRGWSMRGVEDEAGVPHGTARHHFTNQRGLVLAMVRHLLEGDLPAAGESLDQQFARWLDAEAGRTRARYELIVASFHDAELAAELVHGRDLLVAVLRERGATLVDAAQLVSALDGILLDALLRRLPPESVEPQRIIERLMQ
ncbi:TetR/AcrR family transcriptional regulator [Rhodococcus sp. NPDC003382]